MRERFKRGSRPEDPMLPDDELLTPYAPSPYSAEMRLADLDLFCSPGRQRQVSKIVREAANILDARHKSNSASAYGALKRDARTGHLMVMKTPVSLAIEKMLQTDVRPGPDTQVLYEAHPNAPWLQLFRLQVEIEIVDRSNYFNEASVSDITSSFEPLAPLGTHVVQLFEAIAGKGRDHFDTPTKHYGVRYDCDGYWEALYFAGRIAFHSGDLEQASNYLSRYWWSFRRREPHYGARAMLAVSNLLSGKDIPLSAIFTGALSYNETYLAEVVGVISTDNREEFNREVTFDDAALLAFVCQCLQDDGPILAGWVFARLVVSKPRFLHAFPACYEKDDFEREGAYYAHLKPFFKRHPDIADRIKQACEHPRIQQGVRANHGCDVAQTAINSFLDSRRRG